ncbi:uncharacterized protein MYCFIDRAFT_203891 [Pseudocercospora fijiensis CIRAD86]|uniref:Uncharacterized protein n=1 Tax=Pseudocercospora fijiensis (strain CIRAD86) TaxID=383855 RepID=M2ZSN1_PSEFD|nr:uncharacterized protein MYCFIDRAFT_203891 [Pseudocercospora fijiensis CIRAD86]EME82024.1 hypothetical protein MYCFIDRAFT_203891 [Pseudocercospora fijiensis CIRAD86]
MSAQTQYSNASNGYIVPMGAEEHFAQQFDLSNPENARNSYQKVMHQHTKQQFEMATASSRRRSTNASVSTLSPESSVDSVSSTSS